MSIRAIFEREQEARKAANADARLRRQSRPKTSSLDKWKAQESSFFTRLPQEIRHMIYREAFAMLAQTKAGYLLVKTGYKQIGRREVPQTKVLPKVEAPPLGVPALFLVCKQMRYEAKPIFWGSMTFKFDSSFWLHQFCIAKQLPHRRRKHNIPVLFPVPLVRKIKVCIPRNVLRPAIILERFWALARLAHDSLHFKVYVYDMKDEGDPWFYRKNGKALLDIYHQIRVYQSWRKQKGMSLDIESDEFWHGFTDETLFEFPFPGFSDNVEEKKEDNSSEYPVFCQVSTVL